jgi:DNA-binding MarR family transcriptional regulator
MIIDKGIILRGMQESLTDMHRLSGELTTSQLRVLMFVMRRGKATGRDISKALEMSPPTVSRSIATLSDEKISRRAGEPVGFLRLESDPLDRRVRYAVLTVKGQALVDRIVEKFQP